jgi:hypothetical protein
MQVLGDSFQKAGYLYEANDFYQEALQIGPDNLTTLVRTRNIYQELELSEKLDQVNILIEQYLSPKVVTLRPRLIKKNEGYNHRMILDGNIVKVGLSFVENDSSATPLVSIIANSRVVWDGFLPRQAVEISFDSAIGENIVRIEAISHDVLLNTVEHD